MADDVADTGKTLELVRDFCAGYVAEVRTAVVYEKPQSVVQCDYVWRRTDRWIDFPWSSLPPVRRRAGSRATDQGQSGHFGPTGLDMNAAAVGSPHRRRSQAAR